MEKRKIVELTKSTKKLKRKNIVGNENVYDLGIGSNHNFFANGINVHNCTEALLPDNGNCNLGSLNLSRLYDEELGDVDWSLLAKVINIAVRMMDNVLTMNIYPTPDTKVVAERSRRIGFGVMGLHHLLIKMGLRYGSEESIEFIERLFATIRNESFKASIEIAKDKGSFPEFDYDRYLDNEYTKNLPTRIQKAIRKYGLRNAVILSIAPTGTISMVAGTSSGIEPIFAPMYSRKYRVGNILAEEIVVDKMFSEAVKEGKWDHIVGAYDVTPEEHMAVQAAVQDYVDQAISKCVVRGTKLNTNLGTYNIEDLTDEQNPIEDTFYDPKISGMTIIDEFGNSQHINKIYFGGKKECVRVRFSNGKTIDCSKNHRFKTSNGWVRSIDLKSNDRVFYRENSTPCSIDLVSIDIPKFSAKGKKYDFPSHMTEDLAKFLGMWHADGFVNKNSIGIVEKDEMVGEIIDDLFLKIFGVDPNITIDKRSGVKTHYLNSRDLVKYFTDNFGRDCVTKRIPKSIFESNNNIVISYINGLTLDGYKLNKKLVVYDGYSENIATGVLTLLSRLGLKYYFRKRFVKNGLKSKISYGVSFYTKSHSPIEPIEKHKIPNYTESYFVQRFVEQEYQSEILNDIGNGTRESYLRRNFKRSMDMCDGFIDERSLSSLNFYKYDGMLSCVKIVSVEDIGKQEVWDIEVDSTHSYVIDGIVSHNTINVPRDFSHEQLMELILNYSDRLKGLTIYRAGSRQNEPLEAISTTEENVKLFAMKEELAGVVNEGCSTGVCEI